MLKKIVLLHCHIFKNGGTTIDNILKRNFGSAAIKHESSDGQFISSEEINLIARGKDCYSVSSHKLGLPVPTNSLITYIPLVMVRDPLDRLGSMYSFYNRQRHYINHECILAKQNSFKKFVEILLGSSVDSSFVNLQTQFFLGNYLPPKYPSFENWDLLVRNFESACVAILERFDDSMVLWENYLAEYFPNIDLAYLRTNVSYDRAQNLSDRLNKIKGELGEELVAEFEERNKIDYRLYHLVQKRIEHEIGNLTGFSLKKENFLQRNIELAESIGCTQRLSRGNESISGKKNDTAEKDCFIHVDKCQVRKIPFNLDQISSYIRIVGCGMFDCATDESLSLVSHGTNVKIIVAVEAEKSILLPIVGITIKNNTKEIMFSMNSLGKVKITSPTIGKVCMYSFVFKIPALNSGTYSITPAFASGTQENHVPLSCVEDAFVFVVPKMIPQRLPGALYVEQFQINEGIGIGINGVRLD